MAEVVTHKVHVTVWTPCSVLTAMGCGTLLLALLIPTCVAAVSGPPEPRSAPPAVRR